MEISNLSNFKNSSKFYLVQVVSGNLVKSEVAIQFANKTLNFDTALINNNVGYVVSFANNFDNDKIFIANEIAFLLDVEVSSFYKLINEEGVSAIFCKVAKSPEFLSIRMDMVYKNIYDKFIKSGNTIGWMNDILSIPVLNSNSYIVDEEHILKLINMGINSARDGFSLNEDDLEEFKKKYLTMLFFDYIINNSKRNPVHYHIYINKETKKLTFGHIDYFHEISNDNLVSYEFNNRKVDRHAFIKVLYKNYYPYIKEISRTISLHSFEYIKSIKMIVNYGSEDENAAKYILNVKNNINFISKLDNQSSEEYKENKIDFTQCTIRINQNVMSKNLMIQSKYPNKTLEVDADDISYDDGVKVNYEEILDSSGKVNAFVFVGILIIIILIILVIVF